MRSFRQSSLGFLLRKRFAAAKSAVHAFWEQNRVRERARPWVRSPWLCLGLLFAAILLVGAFSNGWPASREVLLGSRAQPPGLVFIWLHPIAGSEDSGLPPDVAPAWSKHSKLLSGAAGFVIARSQVSVRGLGTWEPLVVKTEPALFSVFGVKAKFGGGTGGATAGASWPAVVIDHETWASKFGGSPNAVGAPIQVLGETYRVAGVLPESFHFLSRRPAVYVVQRELGDQSVLVVARAKPGVTAPRLKRELTDLTEDCCAYYFGSGLRIAFGRTERQVPLRFFALAVISSAALLFSASRKRRIDLRRLLTDGKRGPFLRRSLFFLAKTALALTLIFTAGLEWMRSEPCLLFGSIDPANGPLLLWLYIAAAMAVLFWSVADQRARCRVCLGLMEFPVRVGSPGSIFLNWSGTELLCAEGHGILHVAHVAPSWEREERQWIALDESWKSLFTESK